MLILLAAGGGVGLAQDGKRLVRPADDRPRVDAAQLKPLGIEVYESRRLRLFSDIDTDAAKALPPIADQAFDELEKYFGPLPPAADQSEFQVNAYLIKDKTPFEKVGLLKDELKDQHHGRQVGYQLWLTEQPHEYYRRHLLIHEFTHAYMQAVPRMNVPLAYLEGMAEHFGTHHQDKTGRYEWRVVPRNRADYRGHDRLFLMRSDALRRDIPTPQDIFGWPAANFRLFNESYAWAWGLCLFLDKHPRTCERFHKLATSLSDPSAWKNFQTQWEADAAEIQTEWHLFALDAWEGFDFDRMAIDFRPGKMLSDLGGDEGKSARAEIQSNRGWQSSGVLVEKGRRYRVTASGQFTLADKPKPWVSEANGISFRYHNGRPLGRLLGVVHAAASDENRHAALKQIFSLGANGELEPPATGTLYLRLNDHPGELADNTGSATVEIREAK